MADGGFTVSAQELKSHSSTVETVAGSIDGAAEAAATERAGGLVYGVLFDVVALPFLNMWADSIHGYIEKNGELGHAIAAGLASNAETYEGIEEANTTHIEKSGGGSW
jgi:hypothetical protein